jgi:SNF2 family DNA or RNA helicase
MTTSTSAAASASDTFLTYAEFTKQFGLDYKQHQQECVDWCVKNEQQYSHGGLIADEMGLGKTIQILSLIHLNPMPNTLIVVPVALIEQWEKVLKDLKPDTTIITYRGYARKSITQKQLSESICLTTYGEISRTKSHIHTKKPQQLPQEAFASPIHQIQWGRVVFDEAHHLRNNKTFSTTASIHIQSRIKWLLTGTPIQNSIKDFHTLCSVINIPSHLYKGNSIDLKKLTRHYIIKRTKKGLEIPMPKLNRYIVNVPWANEKEAEVAALFHAEVGMGKRHAEKSTPFAFGSEYRLVNYLRAKQMCVLPKLLSPMLENKPQQHPSEEPASTSTATSPTSTTTSTTTATTTATSDSKKEHATPEDIKLLCDAMEGSSKLNSVVSTIITNKDKGRKLVFCEFHKEIDFLESALLKENMKVARIDGRTTKEMKKQIISSEDIEVMILQVKTCSEGLNLQHYNEVYLVTPQWNPCIELQAICRCYRIGQLNNVNVYSFNMEAKEDLGFNGNMETYIKQVQKSKTEIAEQLE